MVNSEETSCCSAPSGGRHALGARSTPWPRLRPPRGTGGAAARVVVLGCLASWGCSPPAGPSSEPAPVEAAPIDEGEADRLPVDRLRALEDAWAARVVPGEAGVQAALQAAALARVRAWRSGDPAAVERARSLLTMAAADDRSPGACEAALALARLEAREGAQLEAARRQVSELPRRFTSTRDGSCVAEARRLSAVLGGARSDEGAPPGQGAPSGSLAPPPASAPAWASLTVHGQEAADSHGVRVVLAFDRPVTFERRDLLPDEEGRPRVVLAMPALVVSDSVPRSQSVDAGGLQSMERVSDGAEHRLVLVLRPGAEARVFALPDPFLIIIDVREAEPVAAAAGAAPPRRLVLLDPGHGGNDYGARAFGLQEAEITLDLARRTQEVLRRRAPGLRVVLTRETPTFISLEQRSAMANAVDADAFVSIHLNAAWEPVARGGITTFVLDTTNDRQAIALAARENGTSTAEVGDLARILAGLRREDQVGASRALATSIQSSTLRAGRSMLPGLFDRGVRSAMFYVLVGATMPAVLVEASFLTYEPEAEALRDERYRQRLANGIAEGIARWAEGP